MPRLPDEKGAAPRSDPTTPNYGFTLPTVGLDRDTWGSITNGNWQIADDALASLAAGSGASDIANLWNVVRNYLEPVGSMKFWPVDAAPAGWWPCDGAAISRTDYADLFALLGTSYGAGDGATTFNLPDMRGRVAVHRGFWIGMPNDRQGETTHVLTEGETPSHYHTGTTAAVGDHTHGYAQATVASEPLGGSFGITVAIGNVGAQTDPAGSHTHDFFTNYRGADGSHNNVQPSMGMCMIIKIQVIY
jgi:microcystin-dependent protein